MKKRGTRESKKKRGKGLKAVYMDIFGAENKLRLSIGTPQRFVFGEGQGFSLNTMCHIPWPQAIYVLGRDRTPFGVQKGVCSDRKSVV